MKNLLFLTVTAAIALSSCEKRANVNGDHGDRYGMLVAKRWIIVSKEVNNTPTSIKDCEKDNYYIFSDNGNGRWEEGAVNCYSGSNGNGNGNDTTSTPNKEGEDTTPTYTGFTWSMTGDGLSIYMKNFGVQGYNPEWNIENMDFTTLDVRSTEKVNGKLYVYNIHLKAL